MSTPFTCGFAASPADCLQVAPEGAVRRPIPLSPDKSLQTFRVSEDFHVELFASEPNVVDPADMAFDENGKIYVAEMIDYPDDPPHRQATACSRIVMLEDRNGDGRIDHSTIFADNLLEVSGLMPWKGGLIFTTAPEMLYLKDTNGDGKADLRQVLYSGFRLQNPQHRIANPRLGIDNWIYVANDGADGKITSPEHPERPPVLVRGADFRFQPISGLAEPASGPTHNSDSRSTTGATASPPATRFICTMRWFPCGT